MIRVGLIGCGNIGSFIARHINRSKKFKLVSVFDIEQEKVKKIMTLLDKTPTIATDLKTLLSGTDLIIEAASQQAVRAYARDILAAGKNLLLMSVGALADEKLFAVLQKEAKRNKCCMYLPSGAICGIDGVKAASVGAVTEVTLTTTKPPAALQDVAYLKKKGVDVNRVLTPTVVYSGLATEAARLFPRNINVSTILGLSGVGLNKVNVKIVVDPTCRDNIHEIHLTGDCGEMYIKLRNAPSPGNPRTSYLACLSAVQTLEEIWSNVRIGT